MNQLIKLLATNRRKEAPRALAIEGDETVIYLYEIIVADDLTAEWAGGVSAQSLVPQIRNIKSGTIRLRINSPGGDVTAAQAIVAAIRGTGAKVIASIDGIAASAATLIAIAADECEISDGALFMIHCAHSLCYGNAGDLRSTADLLDKADSIIAGQYAAKTGKDATDMQAMMEAETWFTAQEAAAAGLVNRVTSSFKAKSEWDLSAYAKAPAARAPIDPAPAAAPIAAAPAPAAPLLVPVITNEHRERQQQRLHLVNRLSYQ